MSSAPAPLSILPIRSKRRKPKWVHLFPLAVSFLSLLAFGIFLVVSTVNLSSITSSLSSQKAKQNEILDSLASLDNNSPSSSENNNNKNNLRYEGPNKGDLEAQVNSDQLPTKIEDRNSQTHRPSSLHPNTIEWPNILDRPIEQYPIYNSLLELIKAWNPDDPDPPSIFRESLQHFNYSNPYEREKAELFRDAEIPFKIYSIPDIDAVQAKWTDAYLLSNLGLISGSHIERSKNNHFMYWTVGNGRGNSKYVPPTTIEKSMTFKNWLELAHEADSNRLKNDTEHYYFMSNAAANDHGRTFISRDLGIFSTKKNNFFISNVPANKGIQCRFGMRGIIAEAHYDSGRNMIAMLKGTKRYILTPPSTCEKLGIITDPSHPSYRHSEIDWSNLEEATAKGFDQVPAIDTIVHEGEILYVPSFWFHYIISLSYSIQCNSRSGTPPRHDGKKHIEECLHLKLNFDRYNGHKKRVQE